MKILPSEITPYKNYLNRRKFIKSSVNNNSTSNNNSNSNSSNIVIRPGSGSVNPPPPPNPAVNNPRLVQQIFINLLGLKITRSVEYL